MAQLDIQANREAAKYTAKENAMRVLWGLGRLLFRWSPRPCFGLRRLLLRAFGAKVGGGVNIYPSALIYYPWNLEIGDDSAIGEWALVYNLGKVRIGARTTISQRVHLCAGTHDYSNPALPLVKPPINVGDEVWVCADTLIGPNITVDNGAVLAAGSVICKDVGAFDIVGGNPAKFIKKREISQ